MKSFFQICVFITICMFLFTLSVQYVNGLGIYGDISIQSGSALGDAYNETIQNATVSPDYSDGINLTTVWALVLTAAGAAGILVAWITRSTAIIGVFIFSAAFWASYVNTLGILQIGGFVDPNFVLIGTAGMGMVWIGAVAGMLSGSG